MPGMPDPGPGDGAGITADPTQPAMCAARMNRAEKDVVL
jgi:hypothetical protein